jgi:hypothetical protein
VDDVLRKSYPLGFARFALIRRGKLPSNVEFKPGNARKLITENRIVYASPLLRMHSEEDSQNYSIARYLWSLRNFPARETLEPWWFIYIPQSELARAMLAAGRRDSVVDIAILAFREVMSKTRKQSFGTSTGESPEPDVEKILQKLVLPILDCTVATSGQVRITASVRSPNNQQVFHQLESTAPSKARPLLSRVDAVGGFADVPAYFAG